MLLHDEVELAPRSDAADRGLEEGVKILLADSDRRIRPHGVETEVRIEAGKCWFGSDDCRPDVRQTVPLGVPGGRRDGVGVGVHRPHDGVRRLGGERKGDRTPAATEVEQE